MPSQALPDLDWSSITPLNGSKQDAFEELCTQLGRASCPVDTEFVRKGRPDSGVEAYAVHSDGTEWAWQAKYFGVMKSGQWSQLEKSVKTALEAHPNLVRYFVCVPLDLSDGRGEGTTTALEQWNARVKKWTKWATDRGMSVEFVWQGSHELFVELAKPQNVHLLGFFFGERSLNDDWFRARLQEAHLAAGPRYTPELNISVPGHASFDAFGRTPAFFETVRAKATRVGDRLRKQPFALVDAASASLQAALDSAQAGCDHVLEAFKLLSSDPVLPDPMGGLLAALLHARRGTVDVMAEYSSQIEAESAVTKVSKRRTDKQREDNYALSQLRELYQELQDALRHVEQYQPFVNGKFVVLTGDAGTGKTHLLCDLAKQRLDQGLPTVILMGQRYLDVSEPRRSAVPIRAAGRKACETSTPQTSSWHTLSRMTKAVCRRCMLSGPRPSCQTGILKPRPSHGPKSLWTSRVRSTCCFAVMSRRSATGSCWRPISNGPHRSLPTRLPLRAADGKSG